MSVIDKIKESKDDISVQEILVNLLNGEDNLETKTHIVKPKQLAVLQVFANLLENRNMGREGILVNDFIKVFLKYMISFDRLSRKEIISAVSELRDKERSNAQKLIMDLK